MMDESGLDSVFTVNYLVVFLSALLFGIIFAALMPLARRMELLPEEPKSSVAFATGGVAFIGFLGGFVIGWVPVVKLALLFAAGGLPMMFETVVANYQAKKKDAGAGK